MEREIAALIKARLPAPEAARRYGFPVGRTGFISCPFHREDTASLRLYPEEGGFYCFGCGAHGSVIDFCMQLFGLSFSEACRKLNDDFSLGLPMGRKRTLRENARICRDYRVRKEEYQRKNDGQKLLSLIWSLWARCDAWERAYVPQDRNAAPDPRYAYAVSHIDYAAYLIDHTLEADRKEVRTYAGSAERWTDLRNGRAGTDQPAD